jgi:hypothetical protein
LGLEVEQLLGHRVELGPALGSAVSCLLVVGGESAQCVGVLSYGFGACGLSGARCLRQLLL